MYDIKLMRCKRSHPAYQTIRDRHYIPNRGAVGQQLHYLIYLDRSVVGIISGGSAVYATRPRDEFFGITKANRNAALNGIINNTVFRLERNLPNLGSQILAMWRKRVAQDWLEQYGVRPCGFETFVIQTPTRAGSMYKADNWSYVGETSGSVKMHLHGIDKSFVRKNTVKKMIFCKWIRNAKLPTSYDAVWQTHSARKSSRWMTFSGIRAAQKKETAA